MWFHQHYKIHTNCYWARSHRWRDFQIEDANFETSWLLENVGYEPGSGFLCEKYHCIRKSSKLETTYRFHTISMSFSDPNEERLFEQNHDSWLKSILKGQNLFDQIEIA